jgi:S1-C subfamily serine protease
MKLTSRTGRVGIAAVMAAVIGGGGVAVGAATAQPGQAAAPAATATASAPIAPQAGYAGVVKKVLPSVVLIRTSSGLGSGVVLDDKGDIVTNAHVAGDATSFQVQRADDPKPRQARLVGSYPAGDLAVIKVDNPSGLTPASFGNSDQAQAGDVVLAVGNPLGLSSSVTEGIISATGRTVSEPAGTALANAIQTSAPINPGNSGGALVTTAGQVIGIPTLAAASPQGGAQAQGIGFAIPSNLARDIAGQLIASGHVTSSHRAAIGAQVATVTGTDGTPAGVGVIAVTQGGPADKAGLRAGDVIRSVQGTPTPDTTALTGALASMRPGQDASVAIVRDGQEMTVHVTLGEL